MALSFVLRATSSMLNGGSGTAGASALRTMAGMTRRHLAAMEAVRV